MLEPIDPSAPNLDGDFKAVLEILSKREKKPFSLPPSLPTLEENSHETRLLEETTTKNHVTPSVSSQDLLILKEELFKSIEKDYVKECAKICKKLEAKHIPLQDDSLRENPTKVTALHRALAIPSMKTAEYLIRNSHEKFLMEECNIEVKGVQSSKTALHQLTEQGHVDLCAVLLDRITPGPVRDQFLRKTVLTEMAGQRPRHLSSIHIAAVNGNTRFIELLVDMGVSVNTTNNKNDTPILWATRNNHISTVKKLILLNADLHCENDKGSTPLYWAIRYGFSELVNILIKEGKADIHQRRKLGLVSPIVLASALGYVEILKILIENGADVNVVIPGGQTSLQMACFHDNEKSVMVLLDNGARIDDSDDSGNTPLMYAVSSQSMSCLGILIQHNANMDCKNKMGRTIWHLAIDQEDNSLLKTLVHFYQLKLGHSTSNEFKLPPGRTPLHVAATKGDIGKLKCLFDIGVDSMSVDQNGNTYFHVAARMNKTDVIQSFIGSFDVNHENLDGDTPLNLAVKYGHIETVKLLIQKAKLDIRNKSHCTVLHVAAMSADTTHEMVKILVDVMVKTTSWALVDAKDLKGNTALNIAAKKGFSNLIDSLSNLNPMISNDLGDTPLHTAAMTGHGETLEALLNIFCQPGKGLHIDQQNNEGETALHICAKKGDSDCVRLLIQNGSDLAIRNNDGNTILHEMCETFTEAPHKKDALTSVYHAIVQEAARWWSIRCELHLPDEDSEMFTQYQKEAMLKLTSGIYNDEGMDVIQYAGSLGSIDMLHYLLSTQDVYMLHGLTGYHFDVTNLAPSLQVKMQEKSKKSHQALNVVDVLKDKSDSQQTHQTFLDIVVSLEDEVVATNILDMTPIKEVISNYWTVYQWLYGLLMLTHVVYMGCFTAFSIPVLTDFFVNESINTSNSSPSAWPMVLFLTWPGLIILFESFSLFSACLRACRGKSTFNWKKYTFGSAVSVFSQVFMAFLSQVTAFVFVVSVVAWFVLYMLALREQVYLVAAILIIGWMFTIAFTKGFEQVHAFSMMLRYIVVKDIFRFLFIYSFFLLGFSFAFNALLQVVPGLAKSQWNTIFTTFNLMLGLHDILDDDFDATYTAANGSVLFVQIIYLGYISLSTIILLNLLIAMMTDTYTAIKAREGTTWRVGSVRLALGIDKSMPFIKKFLKWVGLVEDQIHYNTITNRWILTVPWTHVDKTPFVNQNVVMRSIERLENRILQIYVELSKQVDTVNAKLDRRSGPGFETVKVMSSTVNSFKSMITDRPASAKGGKRRKSRVSLAS